MNTRLLLPRFFSASAIRNPDPRPSNLQCLTLLKSCTTLTHLTQIHAHATKLALTTDPLIAGKLLLLSATVLPDSLCYARRLFAHIPSPDAFMYNTLIRGISDSDHPNHTLIAYTQMKADSSVNPDSFTFAFLLKAAASSRNIHTGTQIHSNVIQHGLNTHLFVGTTLVSFYAECGILVLARKAFDEIPHPNVVAWNAVVTACFRCDDVTGAEEIFKEMPVRDATSWNLMLAGYIKSGELESARRMFLEMPVKDSVSWSSVISGFGMQGCFDDAFGYFRDLLREGGRPNEVSLTGILSACGQAGAFESGRVLHGHIEKAGLESIVAVGNALVDAYARCGNVEMACRVFDWKMGKKNIVSWTSMIAALAMHGLGEEAVKVFNEMEECGTKPDGITFISVLYACSHAGLIDQGEKIFRKMDEEYGIEPSIEHYGCMVDLYGRAGLLDKAYEFVNQMLIRPNARIWRTLLGACSIHGNVRLAEHARRQLSELDPNDSSDYVLLSNIYAMAGRWNDVCNVRMSMTDHGIKKDPGWSSIEVDKAVYIFVASDKSTSLKMEAHEKLVEIMSRLRLEGYIPEVANVLHDIEEEEKQESIARHSEKLAVAFGLARMRAGSVIRIVKNLRVCRDCHTVMKLISKVYQCEIVVRDRSRFHNFREGSCSCRDYW